MPIKTGGYSIPPLAYIIIGAVVAGYSKVAQAKNPDAPMEVFFYVGILLVIVGAGKLAIAKMNKKEIREERAEQKSYESHLRRQQAEWEKSTSMHHQTPAEHNIIHCHKCGTKSFSGVNYCYKCGSQLR